MDKTLGASPAALLTGESLDTYFTLAKDAFRFVRPKGADVIGE